MPADILIFKKRGSKFEVKITKGMRDNHTPESCSIIVNIRNYKDLALFLEDLSALWNAPIDKAIQEYQENKGKWPF